MELLYFTYCATEGLNKSNNVNNIENYRCPVCMSRYHCGCSQGRQQ